MWEDVFLASLRAFFVGGIFCAAAQILLDKTALTPARILVGFVVFGVILGALGWFVPLRDFAGCGATVPLLGFGGAIAEGMRDAIDERGWLGVFTGSFTAAAAGCAAALVFGYISCLLFRSKGKTLSRKKP